MSTSSPDLMSEKNIERIRLSARRISELYEDLTYLFLRDKSEKPKNPLPFDTLLKEQIAYLKPFAERKSIDIATEIEPFAFPIDRESAIRLINNLLSNAIKYSEKGDSVTLKDRTLTVKDYGISIDVTSEVGKGTVFVLRFPQ